MKAYSIISLICFIRIALFSQVGNMGIEVKSNSVIFPSTSIGDKIFMSENLNVNCFRNGDVIFEAKTAAEWINAGKNGLPAWCYYNNNSFLGEKYGKLYNWYAVNDPRGLAPEGWRILDDSDWSILINYLGGEKSASYKMKSTEGWLDGMNGSNESKLNILPSGLRHDIGVFGGISQYGVIWSATSKDLPTALYRFINFPTGSTTRHARDKSHGFSVRCIWSGNKMVNENVINQTKEKNVSIGNIKSNDLSSNVNSVPIGNYKWSTENLSVDQFQNGDKIKGVFNSIQWQQANDNGEPAWCYYNDDPKNGEKY